MKRKNPLLPNHFYHIYNRGIEKRDIFLEPKDYERFLILLYLCNDSKPVNIRDLYDKGLSFVEIMQIEKEGVLVDIGAYCLMPNHVHLLIKGCHENGISIFTKKLFTGYSMFFNKKYQRSGRLFENTFKAELVNEDNYLKYLFSYIHLNPVKLIDKNWKEFGIKDFKNTFDFLKNYRWSSYNTYSNDLGDTIINKDSFPKYFENFQEFNDFINVWLSFPKDHPLGRGA